MKWSKYELDLQKNTLKWFFFKYKANKNSFLYHIYLNDPKKKEWKVVGYAPYHSFLQAQSQNVTLTIRKCDIIYTLT